MTASLLHSSAVHRILSPLSAPTLTSWTDSGPHQRGTAVHTHASPLGYHRDDAPEDMLHFPDPDAI